MIQTIKSIFIAIRPKTLSVSIAPVLVGSSVALRDENFNTDIFLLTLFAALFIQIGTNFANDVYDYIKGADNNNRVGPTRAVQAELISVQNMKKLTLFTFSLAIICGIPLVIKGGIPILIIGSLSIVSGYAYTAGPYPLGYNGWGDFFVFCFFGPIAVCGTFFLQTQMVSIESIISGLILGCLSVTLLCINNIRDVETDRKAGKRTLAVRLGAKFVQIMFIILFLFSYLLTGYLAYGLGYLNIKLFFMLLIFTFPLFLKVSFDTFKLKSKKLNLVLGRVSIFIITFSILFILSILL